MRAEKLIDGLALAGALVALVGVVLAANSALASDKETVDSTAVAIHTASDTTLKGAEAANREAAAAAAAAIERENRLDLDIKLVGHTSLLIAESR